MSCRFEVESQWDRRTRNSDRQQRKETDLRCEYRRKLFIVKRSANSCRARFGVCGSNSRNKMAEWNCPNDQRAATGQVRCRYGAEVVNSVLRATNQTSLPLLFLHPSSAR